MKVGDIVTRGGIPHKVMTLCSNGTTGYFRCLADAPALFMVKGDVDFNLMSRYTEAENQDD